MKYAMKTPVRKSMHPSLFDDLFTRNTYAGRDLKFADRANLPAVNISESTEAFVIELQAPGYDKTDFEIKLKDHVLSIGAEQKTAAESDAIEYSQRGFAIGAFTHRFTLPEGRIEHEKIVAAYITGILTLTLPKRPEEIKKEISRSIDIA